MTLTELRYIIAIARERHFGRAAEACFVSQPTLSVAVRKLEDELGVTLFERSPSEVAVTTLGRKIVVQAQRVLEEVDVITRLAAQGQDDLVGPLRLGAIYTVGPYLLPHLIPLLHQRAPQMPLQIEENYTAVLSERLKEGKLDAIIISLPYAVSGILTEALYEEPFVVLLPKQHPLEQTETVRTGMLAQEEVLLLGAGHCFRDQVLEACPECVRSRSSTDTIQHTLEGSSLETMRLMVASGMGITVVPKTSVTGFFPGQDMLSVRPFAEPAPRRTIALAWRKSFTRPGAIDVLNESILECRLGDGITMLPAV